MISKNLGAGAAQKHFPNKVTWLKGKMTENQQNLFYYFLFLRLTPIVPNWFLNSSAAVVGVPFWTFLIGSLVGQLPYTFILIRTGLMLESVSHIGFDLNVSNTD